MIIGQDGDTAPVVGEDARLFRWASRHPKGSGEADEPIDGAPPHPDEWSSGAPPIVSEPVTDPGPAAGPVRWSTPPDAPLFGPKPSRVVLGVDEDPPGHARQTPTLVEPPADWRSRLAELADRGWFTIALSGALVAGVAAIGVVIVQRQLTTTGAVPPGTGFIPSASTTVPATASAGTARSTIAPSSATTPASEPAAPVVGTGETVPPQTNPPTVAPRRTTRTSAATGHRRTTTTRAPNSRPAPAPTPAPSPAPTVAPTPRPLPSPAPEPSVTVGPSPPSTESPVTATPAPGPTSTPKPKPSVTSPEPSASTNRPGSASNQPGSAVRGPDTVLDQAED
ncbi:MAG: hypothetical protein ACK5RL_20340 [Acidimicrobiales bacterium]